MANKTPKSISKSATVRKPSRSSSTLPCFCGQPDHGAMVQCSICTKYIHYECMGLDVTDLSVAINDSSNKGKGNYVCKHCTPKITPAIAKELSALSKHNKIFKYGMGSDSSAPRPTYGQPPGQVPPSTPTSTQQLQAPGMLHVMSEDQFERLLAHVTTIATAAAQKAAYDVVSEHLEKMQKKNNLVLVGLPESERDNMAQNREDRARIMNYCDELGIPQDSIQSVFRDGRKGNFPRIVKLCFKDRHVAERMEFLTRGTPVIQSDQNNKDLGWKPYVRTDMTYSERMADKQLRETLRARRDAGERNLKIRHGEIISTSTPIAPAQAPAAEDQTPSPSNANANQEN